VGMGNEKHHLNLVFQLNGNWNPIKDALLVIWKSFLCNVIVLVASQCLN
jgi:hypothetical protein